MGKRVGAGVEWSGAGALVANTSHLTLNTVRGGGKLASTLLVT